MTNKKIFQLVTVSKSITLMKGQIEYLRDKGLDVHVVSSKGPEQNTYSSDITHAVNMEREISLKNDFKSLFNMIKLFRKERPYIVNSGTPKAGLIGTLAAFITRRPVRIYTVRGLRLETVTGLKYKILYAMEKLAMYCSTDIIAVSESLKSKIVELKLANKNKIKVLGYGSSNGVNLEKFDKKFDAIPNELQEQLSGNFVIGFVGRIVKDKGIKEVVEMFKMLQAKNLKVKLLLLGNPEKDDSISASDYQYLVDNHDVILAGHVSQPVNYFNHMDVLVSPTYREGFANVSLEAQCVEVPVITTRATGAIDTIEDNQTGFLVDVGESKELTEYVEYLINHPNVKNEMGKKGRKRVEEKFRNEVIWEHLETIYKNKLPV
ncbi:glycosyltransferase family 4 protein [Staphylococcus haemolyticus]|uniref:glycosyltransferase family 4 protein n=1 Tax=Staphylococcus haemolyticus TaxID=1283 RepID=UPI000F85F4A1|nr:glycosyltransferase family 4 protein [Staphylococcus haemolyticus]MCH4351755.1 glycosyltransferase family 4 protein [Staphylococcus haemolyticus]MCH4483982.1 glycosyltransferase family 4 protein [Staphylococcus haemolyticus]MCI2934621.1 glycosyltransferase family 4 protein [Staphylococcus haemolyticus]MEB7320908.1 glycosyltransferase family 4 protein [Staphylococcus haemolyticus]RSZ28975.1 glycosyltransferase family 1 protein [Staphylococcus haemolyticus]